MDAVVEFWNARPCNIKHSSLEIGTKAYFDEVEKQKFFVEPHIIDFSKFDTWQGKKVLEIGCGIGTAAINFAKNGAIYTGVELSDVSLDLTKKRFEVYGYSGTFYNINAEQLSDVVPVEEYDLIYSFGVIHHTQNPKSVITEIIKYMGVHTELRIMLYAKHSWKNIMIEGGYDQPEAQYGCPIANTYTKDDVIELLNPLKIISIVQDHIFPYQIEDYKRREYIKEAWFAKMPKDMFKHLESSLGWHLNIVAKK